MSADRTADKLAEGQGLHLAAAPLVVAVELPVGVDDGLEPADEVRLAPQAARARKVKATRTALPTGFKKD